MLKNTFNKKINPQDDLYEHVNSNWIKKNKIPSNETSWGTFQILRKKNDKILKKIVLEMLNKKSNDNKTKISTLYKQGLDTKKINKLGISPLQPYLDYVDNESNLTKIIATLQKIGVHPFLAPYDAPDKSNSDLAILYITQYGLGLPNKEYYVDKEKGDIREKYKKYMYNQLNNFKYEKSSLNKMVTTIYNIEMSLAEMSLSPTEMRDVQKSYNLVKLSDVTKLITGINFEEYLLEIGLKNVKDIKFNLHNLNYYEKLDKLIKSKSLDEIKMYLKWKLINSFSPNMSKKIETESFNFYSKELSGQKKKDPRWQVVLDEVESYLGEIIGKVYVEKYFNKKKKKLIEDMILNIKDIYGERIKKLDWLSEKTKEKAVKKLKLMKFKTVHPKKWTDFSKLKISDENTFLENIISCNKFYFNKTINKLYKKTDKEEWGMYPQTINAYYNPTKNEMVFPAGIFQDPFFNENKMAESYGGIGAVIAHEITHGFDDQGSQYDETGNLSNWWTDSDKKKFNSKASKIITQFNNYKIHGEKVNGDLTQGENIADLGGLTISYHALKKYMKDNKIVSKDNKLEKQFFYNFALIWRQKITKKAVIRKINTDPHSPNKLRVNGTITNMPEFYEVFGVTPKHKLYKKPSDMIKIW